MSAKDRLFAGNIMRYVPPQRIPKAFTPGSVVQIISVHPLGATCRLLFGQEGNSQMATADGDTFCYISELEPLNALEQR